MSDIIKREDAITAINKSLDRETLLNSFVRKIAIDAIIQVPSADRPQGEWIKAKNDGVWAYAGVYAECDQCHKVVFNGWEMNYCPNCGSRMSKGADDE